MKQPYDKADQQCAPLQSGEQSERFDKVEQISDGSRVQHGPMNDRIYLMQLAKNPGRELPRKLIRMAHEHGYSKIFAKVPRPTADGFINVGYQTEALVPGFYNNREDGFFLGYYLDEERAEESQPELYERCRKIALAKSDTVSSPLDASFELCKCGKKDIQEMAEIYREVFQTYPFPIFDPEYLEATMEGHVDYFGMRCEECGLVALAAAEAEEKSASVEMTDFATLPHWRGHGLATHLLEAMERFAKREGLKTSYTIARAAMPGINITFGRKDYKWCGRLKNNTQISRGIESMNVWYKKLAPHPA